MGILLQLTAFHHSRFFRVADRKLKEIQIPDFFVETLIVLDEFD
jgi:hypothetical protein